MQGGFEKYLISFEWNDLYFDCGFEYQNIDESACLKFFKKVLSKKSI